MKHCASPSSSFLAHWQEGRVAAARMAVQHGFYCVDCCWLLIAFMLPVGAMNPFWMALVSLFCFNGNVSQPSSGILKDFRYSPALDRSEDVGFSYFPFRSAADP